MATVDRAVQELFGNGFVSLYVLDTTPIGGTDIFRFTPMNEDNLTNIVFDGNTYVATDIIAEGFEWDGQGRFPRPTVSISNIDGVITSAIVTFGDIVGSKFYRIRTLPEHLDGGSDPDATATLPIEIYTVDQRTEHTKQAVTWELASAMDNAGVKLPRRQCFRNNCTHRYRQWDAEMTDFDYSGATCPYTGSNFFNENGDSVSSASDDYCGKSLEDCKLRFGENGLLPTRAFPGVPKVRI